MDADSLNMDRVLVNHGIAHHLPLLDLPYLERHRIYPWFPVGVGGIRFARDTPIPKAI